jgi:hypothetical protein
MCDMLLCELNRNLQRQMRYYIWSYGSTYFVRSPSNAIFASPPSCQCVLYASPSRSKLILTRRPSSPRSRASRARVSCRQPSTEKSGAGIRPSRHRYGSRSPKPLRTESNSKAASCTSVISTAFDGWSPATGQKILSTVQTLAQRPSCLTCENVQWNLGQKCLLGRIPATMREIPPHSGMSKHSVLRSPFYDEAAATRGDGRSLL